MMENYFDTTFRYLEETKYSENEVLRKQLQKIKGKVAESFMISGSNYEMVSESNSELLESISECAIDLISLMKLYKYVLENEGKQDLGSYSSEGEQFMFIHDSFISTYMSMLPKGSVLSMNFCNDDEDSENED